MRLQTPDHRVARADRREAPPVDVEREDAGDLRPYQAGVGITDDLAHHYAALVADADPGHGLAAISDEGQMEMAGGRTVVRGRREAL